MIIQLTDWLYQGDYQSVGNAEYTQWPIGAIIALNENNERVHPLPGNNVNYLWCSFNDPGETLTAGKLIVILNFAKIFQELGVLVHCYGGANRSSAICGYLLARIGNYNPREACWIIREKNPGVKIRSELTQKLLELTGLRIG